MPFTLVPLLPFPQPTQAGGEKGERVHMSKCKKPAGAAQTFQIKEIESTGLFRSPFHSVMHAASGLCLTLSSTKEGMVFTLEECKCRPNQTFKADMF